jgi:hypothetical protein
VDLLNTRRACFDGSAVKRAAVVERSVIDGPEVNRAGVVERAGVKGPAKRAVVGKRSIVVGPLH